MYIKDISIGDQTEGFFVLQDAYAKTTMGGKPFLNMILSDCTGKIDAQIWDYTGPVTPKDTGAVVRIRGTVSEFKGTKQITVDRLRLADTNDQYNISDLVPTAPINVEETMQKLHEIIDTIEDSDYGLICEEMLRRYGERFIILPAAKSVHHSFLNGLLMHTTYMLRIADFMAGMYASVIDRSLLIAGTLLHDFAKCEEFTTSTLGLVTDYSMKGQAARASRNGRS